MKCISRVSLQGFLNILSFSFLSYLLMDILRVGSLNVNGGRDRNKRAIIAEYAYLKDINVMFLQETHSDSQNEVELYRWWEGECILSHGTNLSAGVAIIFSKHLDLNILSTIELEKGRILMAIVDIKELKFLFINVYAPNVGLQRIELFGRLNTEIIKHVDEGMCVIMGGDWNCTTNFVLDRNGEEPHSLSSKMLLKITQELDFIDVWRNRNQLTKQYTWVKILDSIVTGARLDRIYVNKSDNNRVMNVGISPCVFSDHHIVTIDFNTMRALRPKSYWHFNVKLLNYKFFL